MFVKKILLMGILSAFAIFLTACGSDEQKTAKTTPDEEVKEEISKETGDQTQNDEDQLEKNWEETVKSIATSDKAPTEKFDEVSIYANDYEVTEDEISKFESYLIDEFDSGNYLSDIKNDEYMLGNIFRSQVVEGFYDDAKQEPIDRFAFDFLQNSKYTYRGVDAVDSESVLSNEEQMKKALQEIQ